MLIKLQSGTVYDPTNGIDGEVRDLYIRAGRIIEAPVSGDEKCTVYDLRGKVVMSGGIDIHTHIGGGKVNIARTLLPEFCRENPSERHGLLRSGCSHATPTTLLTGYRYAEMGYTAAFEPAVLPINARQSHMEMADTLLLDTGGYAILGNDDFLLRMLSDGADQEAINDYVAWTLHATQCVGIKAVNPGGINAFKFNQRKLDVDERNPYYEVTPRQIVQRLSRALHELGVPHPLHIHASNLGVPGNYRTTLETMAAAEGLPLHITHVQFHSYGTEGDRGFSSAAAEIAEAVNRNQNISVDIGQIMFGQTVTISADTMHQHANHRHAHPRKWICTDIECEAGCGVVPFRYRDQNFVNAMQWAIGLELFLMIDDPWRVFLTTDHPNGAPFTSYPHLIRLLMDHSFREDQLKRIHPDVAAHSRLAGLRRDYSLYEIAIMTRSGPARILGLQDRGHLAPGAWADIAVYDDLSDREAMFGRPAYVFKDGELVVRHGEVCGLVPGRTHAVRPEFDRGIEKHLKSYFDRYHTVSLDNFKISADEMSGGIGSEVMPVACGRRESK